MKNIFLTLVFITLGFSHVSAENVFIDFNKVLNTSKAGAAAQKDLKSKFESETKKFKKKDSDIKKEEVELISQKKILTKEDYQKKIQALRKKVVTLQKSKQTSFNAIAKSRASARQNLLKNVNPIIKRYMENNNIKLVLDKQVIILGDSTLEITDQIISTLNKELPSLKLN